MSQLPVEILPEADVQRLIAHPDRHDVFGLRDATILSLLYYAAATAGETAHLDVGDIDWRRGTLSFRSNDGKPRRVPIEEPLREVLDLYLTESRRRLLAHGVAAGAVNMPAVFVTNKGHRVHVQDIRQILGAHSKAVGIKSGVNYNTLRLSRAWHLREAGEPPEKIQRLLGATSRSGRNVV